MSLLLVLAATIGITFNDVHNDVHDSPDAIYPAGDAYIVVTCQGHPAEVYIDALSQDGDFTWVATCYDSNTCAGLVYVDHGRWTVVASAVYRHEDPAGGPYIWAGAEAFTVFDEFFIFEDGFESRDTSAWSGERQ